MMSSQFTILSLLVCVCLLQSFADAKVIIKPEIIDHPHPQKEEKHFGSVIHPHHSSKFGSHLVFSDFELQPDKPAPAVEAPANLVQILSVWKDADVLLALLSEYPALVKLLSSKKPHLVFAPTNHAFLTIVLLFYPDTPHDASPELIIKLLKKAWGILLKLKIYIPTLEELLAYHVVAGEFPEYKIVKAGYLETLQGGILGTSHYPLYIKDENTLFNSRRLGLQISGINGHISFIDNVLLPFDLVSVVVALGKGVMHTDKKYLYAPEKDILFKPFRSIADFGLRRNDITIITAIVASDPVLLKLITHTKYLHVFAPTDIAFVAFLTEIIPKKVLVTLIPLGVEKTLASHKEMEAFAIRLVKFFISVPGLPTLSELILYHIVKTSASFHELAAIGKVPTLYKGAPIIVTKVGVIDLNSVGPDANKIVSFGTRNGFVTVIDAVLLPVDIKIIIKAIIIVFEEEVKVKKPVVVADPHETPYKSYIKKPLY